MGDVPIKGVPGVKTRFELRTYVISHGCFSPEENARIYEKWFARAPRYLFRAVDRRYGISDKILCDVGCSYGMNLAFCVPGSYGIEIDEYAAKFARGLGFDVYERDLEHDDLNDLPRAEVVWCSAVLEHVTSPHIFLRKLHAILQPSGLLALYVPTIPLLPRLKHLPRIGRYITGHQAADHVNAFVPSTITFFCERAGFKTVEVSPFYPGPFRLLNSVPLFKRLIDGCVYVGQRIPDWSYPDKAMRSVALNCDGFIRKPLVARDHAGERC